MYEGVSTPLWSLGHLALKLPYVAATAALCGFFYVSDTSDRPTVVFTFDDGFISDYTKVKPIFEKAGKKSTFYVSGQFIGVDENRLSIEDIKDLQDFGFEIGSHSMNHVSLPSLSYQEKLENVIGVKQFFDENGVNVTGFAYPFGDFDDETMSVVRTSHDYAVNAWSGQNGINKIGEFDVYSINREDITQDKSTEYVCDKINSLKEGDVYVMLMHEVVDDIHQYDGATEQKWKTETTKLEDIMQCATLAKVNVETMREVVFKDALAKENSTK